MSKKSKGYNYGDIDYNQLKKKQEALNQGGGFYLKASKLPEETDFRLLPPHPNQEGIYFLELFGYWIANKFYVSPKTFGLDCPIEEIVKEAEAKDNEDLNALLNSSNYRFIKNYLIPGLILDITFTKKGKLKNYKVAGDQIKILQCGSQLFKGINRLVLNRVYNTKQGGIYHHETGYNIIIKKEGTGIDTEYSATGWVESMVISEKWLKYLPDLKKITKKRLLTDKELREVINGYLYGKSNGKKKKGKKKKDTVEDDIPF